MRTTRNLEVVFFFLGRPLRLRLTQLEFRRVYVEKI